MCKAKRKTSAEWDADIAKKAACHKTPFRIKTERTIQDQLGSMAYERFMRKRSMQLAKEAEARMQVRIERALRFMNMEGEITCPKGQ